jgi:hypothetical protein
MDRTQKPKKTVAVYDEADTLVSAIVGEFLAPENLNLMLPITMFAVLPAIVES